MYRNSRKLEPFNEPKFEIRNSSLVDSFEFYQNELRKLLKPYDIFRGCQRDEYAFTVVDVDDKGKEIIPYFDFVREIMDVLQDMWGKDPTLEFSKKQVSL